MVGAEAALGEVEAGSLGECVEVCLEFAADFCGAVTYYASRLGKANCVLSQAPPPGQEAEAADVASEAAELVRLRLCSGPLPPTRRRSPPLPSSSLAQVELVVQ